MTHGKTLMPNYENIEKNIFFDYKRLEVPCTMEQLQTLVADTTRSGGKIKVVGGRHTFSNITKTSDTLVDLRHFCGVTNVDLNARTAEVRGGTQLGDAIAELNRAGLHFSSLGGWYGQTVAGAIATSTHGSSMKHGSLSDIVLEVEVVVADGSVVTIGPNDDNLKFWRTHLGQLGIITKVKFQLEPRFFLRCATQVEDEEEGFRQILDRAVSEEYASILWLPYREKTCTRILTRTDVRERNRKAKQWEKRYTKLRYEKIKKQDMLAHRIAHRFLERPRGLAAMLYQKRIQRAFLEDNGVVDKSYRLLLYEQYREPTENRWLRMVLNVEYALDTATLPTMYSELRDLIQFYKEQGQVINYPRLHFRFAPASDQSALGLNAERKTVYASTYIAGAVRHKPQIPIGEAIDRIFVKHGGRPHWGKYRFFNDPTYRSTYSGWAAFEQYRAQIDPNGTFFDTPDMFAGLDSFEPQLDKMEQSKSDKNVYDLPIRLL